MEMGDGSEAAQDVLRSFFLFYAIFRYYCIAASQRPLLMQPQ